MTQRWILDVKEDENGEAMLEFPEDLLREAGWKEGTRIRWTDRGDGSWSLTSVDNEDQDDDDDDDAAGWDELAQDHINDDDDDDGALTADMNFETVEQLYNVMKAGNIDTAEVRLSRASGIGVSMRIRYRGEIDGTDYNSW